MRTLFTILIITFSLSIFSQSAYIRTYGESDFNYGKGILALPDTSYIICANSSETGETASAWIFRIDSLGTILWQKYLHTYSVQKASDITWFDDSTFIICGTALHNSDYQIFATKMTINGDILWERDFGDNTWNLGSAAVVDNEKRIWLTGTFMPNENSNTDAIIYKIDGNTGDSLAFKRFDTGVSDKGLYIDTLSPSFLILTTQNEDIGGDSIGSKIYKLDYDLNSIWERNFGNDTNDIMLRSTTPMSSKRISYCGSIRKRGEEKEYAYLGYISNESYIEGEDIDDGTRMENINRVIYSRDSIIYGFGTTINGYFGNHDFGLNCDSSGYFFFRYFGALQNDYGEDIVQAADGGFAMIGSTENFAPHASNILLIKLDKYRRFDNSNNSHITQLDEIENQTFSIKVFPNPNNGIFNIETNQEIIEVKINDIYGNSWIMPQNQNSKTIDISHFSKGIYILSIETIFGIQNIKVILQ